MRPQAPRHKNGKARFRIGRFSGSGNEFFVQAP
jgi:hypothetical protein